MILPTILLALLLLASGTVKLRSAARAEVGLHLPSLLEILAGLALMSVGFVQTVSLPVIVGGVLLVLGSSLHLFLRLRRRRALRERTEGRRLETYIRYLSEQESDGP